MQRYPMTLLLLILLAGGFVGQYVCNRLIDQHSDPYPPAFLLGAVTENAIEQPYRLVTATLLHAGFVHIAINAWMLLQLGSVFELLFGSRRLAVVYGIAAVFGSLTSCMWLEPGQISVGASGAIFGVVGALLVMIGGASGRRWAKALHAQLALWAVITLFLGFLSPAVDNAAHVGGLIAGAAVGVVFRLRPEPRFLRA